MDYYWTRGQTIGHGSTATVSVATSPQSDVVFAAKSTELSQSEFLQREQKILSSITSPYIVSYKGYDITKENNTVMYNLFLEYMSGGSLTDSIRANGGRLKESVIGNYTCQIVEGLNYLHSNGIVHCDIKSSNILVGDTGVKIADFGCAKRVAETAERIGGTPMFMAPEVARGEKQGFESDMWGLGCMIIEMASGCLPWANADDPVSAMYRIGFSDDSPEIPSWLSEEAKDFAGKCLRRDAKQRWTAQQLLNHPFLEKFINSKQIQIQEFHNYNSPTSILDQDIWNSLDDMDNAVNSSSSSSSSASERIRRLCLNTDGPTWNLDGGDDDWITVRFEEGDIIMDEIEVKDDLISYDSVYQNYCDSQQCLNGVVLDSNSRISGDYYCFLGDCKYEKDSFIVSTTSSSNLRFDRDNKDVLFNIPHNSRLVLQA
ncbi:mitogen-activated protein kinase kinase kinase 18 [Mercurialis annua]|uniref:mitogen-activated protein kinase kinase kinase 18 n=1 Tax=Mercurialis annua TaxID=3986 RepID=UPI0021601651|nr:mitogen-activated protein kinase kinase kinase 18 [Mercurialis annua]